MRNDALRKTATRVAHRSSRIAESLLERLVQHVQERLVGFLGLDAFTFDAIRNREAVEYRLNQRRQPFELGLLDNVACRVQGLVDDLTRVLLQRSGATLQFWITASRAPDFDVQTGRRLIGLQCVP